MISKGANIEAKDNDGKTPLDLAKANGKQAVVNVLKQWKTHQNLVKTLLSQNWHKNWKQNHKKV